MRNENCKKNINEILFSVFFSVVSLIQHLQTIYKISLKKMDCSLHSQGLIGALICLALMVVFPAIQICELTKLRKNINEQTDYTTRKHWKILEVITYIVAIVSLIGFAYMLCLWIFRTQADASNNFDNNNDLFNNNNNNNNNNRFSKKSKGWMNNNNNNNDEDNNNNGFMSYHM